jgi:hypothetical protein
MQASPVGSNLRRTTTMKAVRRVRRVRHDERCRGAYVHPWQTERRPKRPSVRRGGYGGRAEGDRETNDHHLAYPGMIIQSVVTNGRPVTAAADSTRNCPNAGRRPRSGQLPNWPTSSLSAQKHRQYRRSCSGFYFLSGAATETESRRCLALRSADHPESGTRFEGFA